MENEGEEEPGNMRGTRRDRKEGWGKESMTEHVVTLRLKAGTENQTPTKEAKNRTGGTPVRSAVSNAIEKADKN